MARTSGAAFLVVLALAVAGCATTSPAVPPGTRVYLERVSYVGEERATMGRAFAPMLEAEIRKLIDSAGVVTFVSTAEQSTADYALALRITDVHHQLDIHHLLPQNRYSAVSELFIKGESRLTPIRASGGVVVRRFPVHDREENGFVFASGGIAGPKSPFPYDNTMKPGAQHLLELHAWSVASDILSDLVFVTSESLLEHYGETSFLDDDAFGEAEASIR